MFDCCNSFLYLLAESLFIKHIIQNRGTSDGLMFFAVANDERICVCVGLDFPLQRKNTTRFQSAELQRIFESTGGSSRWIEKITR